jgi:hypothetical protein
MRILVGQSLVRRLPGALHATSMAPWASLKTLYFHFWDTLCHAGVPEYEKYFKTIEFFIFKDTWKIFEEHHVFFIFFMI